MKILPASLFALACVALPLAAVDYTGYEKVWSDDFESEVLNPDYWTYDAGIGVWNTETNAELQFYTDRPQNVRLEDGKLIIEGHREVFDVDGNYAFTSGRVKSAGRMNFQYGILKARIKLPDLENGLWPAFWTLGDVADGWPQGGEIDILEAGHEVFIKEGTVNQKSLGVVHWSTPEEKVDEPWLFHSYFPNPDDTSENYIFATVDSLQTFHDYTLVWTETTIHIYIDDEAEPFYEFIYDPTKITEFTEKQSVIFNLAVGGNFPELRTPGQITAPFPAVMEIESIELWQKPGVGALYTADLDGARLEGKVAIGAFAEGTDGTTFDTRVAIDDETGFIFSWNNLTISEGTDPSEGSTSLGLDVPNVGDWFGGGLQTLSHFQNMEKFIGGHLVLDVKTTSNAAFRFGIGSMITGNGESAFAGGEEKYGLLRDGQWHTVRLPLGSFGDGVDLATVNTFLYIVGEGPGTPLQMEIDNIYWEEATEPVATPENGTFGIFTDNPDNMTAGAFDYASDGELFLWENSLVDAPATTPSEGEEVWSFQSAPGLQWFGLGLYATRPLNLTAFEDGTLHFDLKTSSNVAFRVGMKSDMHRGVGQWWLEFPGNGNDPYGFARDGNWHTIDIPMSELLAEGNINLFEVVQVFEVLGVKGAISNLHLDNIYLSGGGSAQTNQWNESSATPDFSDGWVDNTGNFGWTYNDPSGWSFEPTYLGWFYRASYQWIYVSDSNRWLYMSFNNSDAFYYYTNDTWYFTTQEIYPVSYNFDLEAWE